MSEDKPKVLLASDCFLPRWDGVARFLSQIIPGLANDFDVSVVAPRFPGKEPQFEGLDKVDLNLMPTLKRRIRDYNLTRPTLKTWRTILRKVGEADIVFVQTLGPVIGLLTVIAAKLKKKPVVTYVHSIESELLTTYLSLKNIFAIITNAFIKFMVRILYNQTTLIIVPSREIGELLAWNGIKTRKAVVHLGIDVKRFSPPLSREKAKKAIDLDPETLTIGFLPRLTGEKDPLTLLRAFARVRKHYPKIKLLVIGDGDKKIIKKFADQSDVWLLGVQSDVVPYLQAMDINVLPSLTETTSLSTFEAMACGCAVISTPVGFIKEYIQHNKNGLLFPQRDVYRLARYLRRLLDNPEIRERLGMAARKTVAENFSWDLTLRKIQILLKEELERNKDGREQ